MEYKKTLEQYINEPVTLEEIKAYQEQSDKQIELGNKLLLGCIAICLLLAVGIYFAIDALPGEGDIVGRVLASVGCGTALFLPMFFCVGQFVGVVHPASFEVHKTRFYGDDKFDEGYVDPDKIKGSKRACELYDAIQSANRKPYKFEVELMRQLCFF
ncbi:hypothetical protein P3447_09180 [Vibrio parahaemolyticus]|nr:hypothetical protein [Vibrio parahaemolyticus]